MDVTVPVGDVVKKISVDIKVSGMRALRFRLWLCAKIILLAGKVGGFNMTVEIIHPEGRK